MSHNIIRDIRKLMPLKRLKKLTVYVAHNPYELREGWKSALGALGLSLENEPKPGIPKVEDEKINVFKVEELSPPNSPQLRKRDNPFFPVLWKPRENRPYTFGRIKMEHASDFGVEIANRNRRLKRVEASDMLQVLSRLERQDSR